MSNIGKKVRIKNYGFYAEYNGKIGTIVEDKDITFLVKMEDGKIIEPWSVGTDCAQCEFVEEEFTLPGRWCILVTEGNSELINSHRKFSYSIIGKYLAFEGKKFRSWGHKNDFSGWGGSIQEITTEQFKEHVLGIKSESEFVLPRRWFIKRNNDNYWEVNKYLESISDNKVEYSAPDGFAYSEKVNNHHHRLSCTDGHSLVPHSEFTEITFEQFKKYVLKEEKMIYTFKPEMIKYQEAADKIAGVQITTFEKNSSVYNELKAAGVLEAWFNEGGPKYKVGDILKTSIGSIVKVYRADKAYKLGTLWVENTEDDTLEFGNNCVLATEKEIKDHLFKTFKEGQIVVCTERICKVFKEETEGGAGYEKGKVFKIDEINARTGVAWDENQDKGVYLDWLRPANKKEIANYEPPIVISSYKPTISEEKVHFGCQSFSKEQLIALRGMFRSEFTFEIKINGEIVTSNMLDRLIKML